MKSQHELAKPFVYHRPIQVTRHVLSSHNGEMPSVSGRVAGRPHRHAWGQAALVDTPTAHSPPQVGGRALAALAALTYNVVVCLALLGPAWPCLALGPWP